MLNILLFVKEMIVAINALYCKTGRVGGTETYLYSLLRDLQHLAQVKRLIVYVCNDFIWNQKFSDKRVQLIKLKIPARYRPLRLLAEQFFLPQLIKKDKVELLINPGYTAPGKVGCPSLLVLPDLQFRQPKKYLPLVTRLAHRLMVNIASLNAAKIICLSQAVARNFADYYPHLLDSLEVIPPTFYRQPLIASKQPKDNLLFNLATTHSHKNQLMLIDLLELLNNKYGLKARLRIIGIKGFAYRQLVQKIAASSVSQQIELQLNASDRQLQSAFAEAKLFLFPTLYEGFGFAPLEALAQGLPVISSDLAVTREVLAGGAIFCHPDYVEEWAAKINLLLSNRLEYKKWQIRGEQRLKQLSELKNRELLAQLIMQISDREKNAIAV